MAFKQIISLLTPLLMVINVDCHVILMPKVKNSELKQNEIPTILSSLKNNRAFSAQPERSLSDDPNSYWLPDSNGFEPQRINLGTSTSSVSSCATILTASNCVLNVPDDSIHKDILFSQFVLTAGIIKDQCSLTIQDCSGSYSKFTNYLFPSGSACNTAASVCCECNGCSRSSFPLYENSCALLFEHAECSLCNGFRLEVADGDEVENLNMNVDNTVSSIYVLPQCELTIYHDPNFQGYAALASGSLDYLPFEWNDVISSYKCECHNGTRNSTTPSPTLTTTANNVDPESPKPSTVITTTTPVTIITTTVPITEPTTTIPTTEPTTTITTTKPTTTIPTTEPTTTITTTKPTTTIPTTEPTTTIPTTKPTTIPTTEPTTTIPTTKPTTTISTTKPTTSTTRESMEATTELEDTIIY